MFATSTAHSAIEGAQAIEVLLEGRSMESLNCEELSLLAKAYNWTGDDKAARDAGLLALAQNHRRKDLLDSASLYVQNLWIGSHEEYVRALRELAENGPGPRLYWQSSLFWIHMEEAYQDPSNEDWDWTYRDSVFKREELVRAEEVVREMLDENPDMFNRSELGWFDLVVDVLNELRRDSAAREVFGDLVDRCAKIHESAN